MRTYATSTASEAASTATSTATATARASLTTLATTCTFATANRSLGFFTCWFRLSSELNGNLAFEYFFARELSDSLLRFFSSLEVDESITHWAVCARVDRDGSGFTVAGTVNPRWVKIQAKEALKKEERILDMTVDDPMDTGSGGVEHQLTLCRQKRTL